jgi:hypothetical protein
VFKIPRDTPRLRWTHHVVRKMQFYGLTPSRVLRVVRAPERTEEGIAPGTIAGMHKAGTKAKPWEIWSMWRVEGETVSLREIPRSGTKTIIITAWRYPGTSPIRDKAPMPAGLLSELRAEGVLE